MDPGVCARAHNLADAVDVSEPQAAPADRELVPVERPRRRACGTVALGVEDAAVAGTAEAARRLGRNEPDPAGARPLQPVPLREDRPVRLAVGDTLDFWRVEAFEQDRLLRLSAEMKTPGRIWLRFEADGAHLCRKASS